MEKRELRACRTAGEGLGKRFPPGPLDRRRRRRAHAERPREARRSPHHAEDRRNPMEDREVDRREREPRALERRGVHESRSSSGSESRAGPDNHERVAFEKLEEAAHERLEPRLAAGESATRRVADRATPRAARPPRGRRARPAGMRGPPPGSSHPFDPRDRRVGREAREREPGDCELPLGEQRESVGRDGSGKLAGRRDARASRPGRTSPSSARSPRRRLPTAASDREVPVPPMPLRWSSELPSSASPLAHLACRLEEPRLARRGEALLDRGDDAGVRRDGTPKARRERADHAASDSASCHGKRRRETFGGRAGGAARDAQDRVRGKREHRAQLEHVESARKRRVEPADPAERELRRDPCRDRIDGASSPAAGGDGLDPDEVPAVLDMRRETMQQALVTGRLAGHDERARRWRRGRRTA